MRILSDECLDAGHISLRAGGDETIEIGGGAIEFGSGAAALEGGEDVAASVIRGHLEGVAAVDGVAEVRVGAVVEEHFDHDEAVIAADGMLEGRMAPLGHVVGVGAAVEGEEEAFFVVPVGFAGGEPGEGTLVAAAGVDEDSDDGVVVGFRCVVAGLVVVGIGGVFEQEAGEAGMPGETGGAVEDGFEEWGAVVDGFHPTGVGAGSGVEEGARGGNEGFGTGFVEAEIAGEGEAGEGVPVVRAACCCG